MITLGSLLTPDGKLLAARFSASMEPDVQITSNGLVVTWQAPEPQLQALPDGTLRVSMPGYALLGQPGAPQVPFAAALVAIPPGIQPRLELQYVHETKESISSPLAFAPQPQGVLRDESGQIIGGGFAPASPTNFAPQAMTLELLGEMRGVRLARLVFYPIIPNGDHLRIIREVRAAVHFEGIQPNRLQALQASSDPILTAIQSTVINPEQAYASQSSTSAPEISSLENAVHGPSAVIEVEQHGLVDITYQALDVAGFPVNQVNPKNLQLYRAGMEIAYEWFGNEDEDFELNEFLRFYANPRFSRWTNSDIYFLQANGLSAKRMDERTAGVDGLLDGIPWIEATFEENIYYTPDCYCPPIPSGRDGDRWVWEKLRVESQQPYKYNFQLTDVDTSLQGQIDIWLIGATDPDADTDHLVSAALNGKWVGSIDWKGKQAVKASFVVSAGTLKEGENTLALSLPGIPGVHIEAAFFDAFTIRYRRASNILSDSLLITGEQTPHAYSFSLPSGQSLSVYDISDPDQPKRVNIASDSHAFFGDESLLGNRSYWLARDDQASAPLDLRLAAPLQNGPGFAGANYLIITPEEFAPGLGPLIALRQSQGLQIAVEQLQAIYDHFGDGRPDPAAIRSYLQHAYNNWTLRPEYVLLVGDGASDPKRYHASSATTFIPPYLDNVDPWTDETAADNRYVTLSGSDNLPEMIVGRLPVNNLAELGTVVDKIVGYETGQISTWWKDSLTLIADAPDGINEFHTFSDMLAGVLLQPPASIDKLYYENGSDAGQMRQNIIQDWNYGAGTLVYAGHASIHFWSKENIFHIDDIPQLQNQYRLPVVLQMTCFTGSFQIPALPTLDEALLRKQSGGAVAVWGSTGLGIATGHQYLGQGYLQSVYKEGGSTVGNAALAGKLNMAAYAPQHLDLIDTFTILGDPATQVNLESTFGSIFLPLTIR